MFIARRSRCVWHVTSIVSRYHSASKMEKRDYAVSVVAEPMQNWTDSHRLRSRR